MATERANIVTIERGIRGYQDSAGNTRLTASVVVTQYTKAKEESTGILEFLGAFMAVFIGSIFLTIGWLTGMIIPIAMIVVGSKYIDQCPAEKMIPIALIVGGVFILVLYLFSLLGSRNDEGERNSLCLCCKVVIHLFLAIWLIVGSVVVYRNFKPDFDDIACERTVYTFAFWLLNGFYIFAGAIFVIMVCALCCYCLSN